MSLFNDWNQEFKPLLEKYKEKKHPLNYNNLYQLLVMVVLSAQDSDANINKIAPVLFDIFPNMESLSVSNIEDLVIHISKINNFNTKANWLLGIAQTLKKDNAIPITITITKLLEFKGIGRKSANVIIRESGNNAEGIIVDLHVIRVAPRIGIVQERKDGNKIEKQLMEIFPKAIWGEVGMAISFLGREICRPTNPKCEICPIAKSCYYYNNTNLN